MPIVLSDTFQVDITAAPTYVPGEPWGYKVNNDGFGISQGGTFIDGGRGQDPQYVTNLNPTGAGSLKERAENGAAGPILFEVGGIVDGGTTRIFMSGVSDKTIWGNVAPGGHFNLHQGGTNANGGWTIRDGCDNIIVQHITIRGIDNVTNRDCFYVICAANNLESRNILVSQCSFAYGCDEMFGVYAADAGIRRTNSNITYHKCFSTFPLQRPTGANAHGLNSIFAGHGRVGIIECIYHLGRGRPLFRAYEDCAFLNSLHYQWQSAECLRISGRDLVNSNTRLRWEGMKYIGHNHNYPVGAPVGVNNPSSIGAQESSPDISIYTGAGNDYGGFNVTGIGGFITGNEAGFAKPDGYDTNLLTSAQLDDDWIDTVGANPATPDSTDIAARHDIKTQTGEFIDHPSEMGGYPNLPNVSHAARGGFTNNNTFGNGDTLQEHLESRPWWNNQRHDECTQLGYANRTRLEAYLDTFISGVPGVDPNL